VPQPASVLVRRSYAECRFGQLHIWTAYPSGGGFDERTPLLCLHDAGGSGRFFAPALPELGRDRSVYAPDLAGHGASDPDPGRYTPAELASAIGDFLDSLRLRQVDICGYELGTLVATELALARPQQVRRLILWGVPNYSPQERAAAASKFAIGLREDGSDVTTEWQRALTARDPSTTATALMGDFAERLRSGLHAIKAWNAVLDYPVSQRLSMVKQHAVILRPRDDFWEQAPRTRSMLVHGSLQDLPDYGARFLHTAPQRFAAIAREFLDR
jgi:pimeloyl-ACP methyl ester carboxylesterase